VREDPDPGTHLGAGETDPGLTVHGDQHPPAELDQLVADVRGRVRHPPQHLVAEEAQGDGLDALQGIDLSDLVEAVDDPVGCGGVSGFSHVSIIPTTAWLPRW
jgi:hypothetical protein